MFAELKAMIAHEAEAAVVPLDSPWREMPVA